MKRTLICGTLLFAAACKSPVEKHLSRAQELSFAHNGAGALKEFNLAIDAAGDVNSPAIRELRAKALRGAGDLCYLELSDYPHAVEYYRALASRYPSSPLTLGARANLAEILRSRMNDRRGAVAQLCALVQTFPSSLEASRYQYLAAADYFELGDYQQVVIEARSLLERYPTSDWADDAVFLRAAALAMQGHRNEAIQSYMEVLDRWPGTELAARSRFSIGKLYAEAGDNERAIETFVASLEDHPDPKMVQREIQRLRRRAALTRPANPQDSRAVWDHRQKPVREAL